MKRQTVFRSGEQTRPPPLGKDKLLDHPSLFMDPLASDTGPKKMTAFQASQEEQNSISKERDGNLQVHAAIGGGCALNHNSTTQ